MSNWWEEQHLGTDFSKFQIAEVSSDVYDQPAKQRIYGAPVYDQDGNLRCRACGKLMNRSMTNRGLGVSCCSDTGCLANGFEFAEGSFFNNPGRTHGHQG